MTAPNIGKKTSWPVALPAVKMPSTVPRFLRNQRLATVAPKVKAMQPAPRPTHVAHNSSCQIALTRVTANDAQANNTSAQAMVLRTPYRSMAAAANGPVRPKSAICNACAIEICPADHPNSDSNGRTNIVGADNTPAAHTKVMNVAPVTSKG